MTDTHQDPWTRGSTWTIVSADLDLEHVFAVKTKITFEFDDGGFKVVPVDGPTKVAECFKDTFLRRAGSVPPTLEDVEGINTLANFDSLSDDDRSDLMDALADHVDGHKDLLRLEGTINILCHETDKQRQGAPPPRRRDHDPERVPTDICVYQIDDPGAKGPFLLIRAPLSPKCPPANSNGSAVGQP